MAVIKITSQNIGFSVQSHDVDEPTTATITGQYPSSISVSPISLNVTSPTLISNFVAGQKTFTYITSSLADVTAIEAAVTVIPASSECV